jgi:hypothetical protein
MIKYITKPLPDINPMISTHSNIGLWIFFSIRDYLNDNIIYLVLINALNRCLELKQVSIHRFSHIISNKFIYGFGHWVIHDSTIDYDLNND